MTCIVHVSTVCMYLWLVLVSQHLVLEQLVAPFLLASYPGPKMLFFHCMNTFFTIQVVHSCTHMHTSTHIHTHTHTHTHTCTHAHCRLSLLRTNCLHHREQFLCCSGPHWLAEVLSEVQNSGGKSRTSKQ